MYAWGDYIIHFVLNDLIKRLRVQKLRKYLFP